MSVFDKTYVERRLSHLQTKEELEEYIRCVENYNEKTMTLREQTINRETVEYAKSRILHHRYKNSSDWSPVKFIFPDLEGDELPPHGYWVEWKTKDGIRFRARFKEDAIDHFWPQTRYDIENVVAWRWF